MIISTAAAQIARQALANFITGGVLVAFQQRNAGHNLTRSTKTALRGKFRNHCFLQRMETTILTFNAFNGDNIAFADTSRQRRAGISRHAVNDNRARATFTTVTDYIQTFEICLNDIWDDYIADQEKAWKQPLDDEEKDLF